MAKKKKKVAPKPVSSSFDAARFRQGEEASMADMPEQAPDTPVADEQTRMAATEPVRTLTLTGAQRAQAAIQDRNKRFQDELAARAASKPTEDPGPGHIWSYNVREGRWKKVFVGGNVNTKSGNSDNVDNSGGGTIFRMIGGILYANGSKYTGVYQGKNYVDGVEQAEDNSDNKTTYTAPDGKIFTNLDEYNAYVTQLIAEDKRRAGQSAYDLLFSEFDRYGMGALLNDVKEFIVQGLSRDELLLKLRATPAYEKRFAANAQRIKKGLRALSEAEYINLEDQYQDVMRRYGLPESYYTRGDMGVQQGFEKFLAGDVSPLELEDRIQTGQRRVLNAPKEVKDALTQFYGAELGSGDILAYVLDPEKAIENIKRKVTAAEIGAGAMQAGLGTGLTRAEELERFGVTGERARTGYAAIAEFLPSAQKLGDIYAKQGLGAYNQATAEQEVFGITGAADAATKRRKLSELETAQFGGSSGITGGALSRQRAGQF